MQAALKCSGNPTTGPTPVLFIHGTTSNSKANWSWTWNRELDKRSWAYCDIDLPNSGTSDIQVSAEYVTFAIRTLYASAGRPISMVGHSQGGMIGRWSLKYWPDTRAMVDDYVGLASSNHGAQTLKQRCKLGICAAADWQQSSGSKFLTALNTGPETWPGVDYTTIRTNLDELVRPLNGVELTPGPNVTNTVVQRLCPLEVVEHFGMAYDNAAWLIGLDALTHDGPAVFSRVPRHCTSPFMPGVVIAQFPANSAAALAETARATATAKPLKQEPALQGYAQ
jgi:triacylglycerol esterase/lipase EstA (alpha/beta hydrolase family)